MDIGDVKWEYEPKFQQILQYKGRDCLVVGSLGSATVLRFLQGEDDYQVVKDSDKYLVNTDKKLEWKRWVKYKLDWVQIRTSDTEPKEWE